MGGAEGTVDWIYLGYFVKIHCGQFYKSNIYPKINQAIVCPDFYMESI